MLDLLFGITDQDSAETQLVNALFNFPTIPSCTVEVHPIIVQIPVIHSLIETHYNSIDPTAMLKLLIRGPWESF